VGPLIFVGFGAGFGFDVVEGANTKKQEVVEAFGMVRKCRGKHVKNCCSSEGWELVRVDALDLDSEKRSVGQGSVDLIIVRKGKVGGRDDCNGLSWGGRGPGGGVRVSSSTATTTAMAVAAAWGRVLARGEALEVTDGAVWRQSLESSRSRGALGGGIVEGGPCLARC
jgi:hypothetical protein